MCLSQGVAAPLTRFLETPRRYYCHGVLSWRHEEDITVMACCHEEDIIFFFKNKPKQKNDETINVPHYGGSATLP
jgi:hypothetical protein